MARIRSIHPGAPADEDVAAMSWQARLTWAYLPCHADREGRMKDAPFTLKLAILPTDAVDMNAVLDELQRHRHIVRYEADGRRYIQIRSFTRYQAPHVRETASSIPAPGEALPRQVLAMPGPIQAMASPSGPDQDPSQDRDPGPEALPARAPAIPGAAPPTPAQPYTGPKLMLWLGSAWTAARAAEFGGTGFGAGNGISSEKIRDTAEKLALAPEAVPHVDASMRRFWATVKAGEHEAAAKCAQTPAFAWAAWWGSFGGYFEAVTGAAPKIPRGARATGPPDRRFGHARAEDQKHTKSGEVEV